MALALSRFMGAAHKAAAGITLGRSITYRLFIREGLEQGTGIKRLVTHDVRVHKALASDVSIADVTADAGSGSPTKLQIGDRRFEFPVEALRADLPRATAGAMTTSDRIQVEGAEYRVLRWMTKADAVLVVFGRRA